MELEAELRAPLAVGRGPYGTRQIFEVVGGTFEGPKLRGKLLPCGGDWFLVSDDGVGRLDVRATLQTHDDALIYATYGGVLELNDRVVAATSGQREAEYGDGSFFTQPRFETGDERYAWINRVVALGEGKVGLNRVAYRIHRAVQG